MRFQSWPLEPSVSAERPSVSFASPYASHRRWDVTFNNYVGDAPLLTCSAEALAGTGVAVRVQTILNGGSSRPAGSILISKDPLRVVVADANEDWQLKL